MLRDLSAGADARQPSICCSHSLCGLGRSVQDKHLLHREAPQAVMKTAFITAKERELGKGEIISP